LLRSRYSAAQFIKMTAQIDSLREELQRERKARWDIRPLVSEYGHLTH
jgi:hypothetical protein